MAELENFETEPSQVASLPSPSTQPAQATPDTLDPDMQKQFDELSRVMNEAAKGQQPPTPQPQPVDPRTFNVPDARAPEPGTYDPAKEQRALQMADQIPDPIQRMRVKQQLKQSYANDRIMDGVVQQARENNEKKAVGQYIHSVAAIRDDPSMGYQEKQAVTRKLIQTMWNDPRVQVGETAARLEKSIEGMVGIESTTEFGPGYHKLIDGIDSGQIKTAEQILHMENVGAITPTGLTRGIAILNAIGKPDERLKVQLENGAIKQGILEAYGKFDENGILPNEKPGPKQIAKSEDISRAITLELMAAGGDVKEIQRITDPKHVKEIADRVYPPDQRAYDYVHRMTGTEDLQTRVPPTVLGDDQHQNEAKWIFGTPPTAMNPETKKLEAVDPAGWTAAVESLRQNPTPERIAKFNRTFPGKDGAHIVQALGPYVSQEAPAGAVTPPVAEPSSGWMVDPQWRQRELEWLRNFFGARPAATEPSPAKEAGRRAIDRLFGVASPKEEARQ